VAFAWSGLPRYRDVAVAAAGSGGMECCPREAVAAVELGSVR